jgi:DNA repair exonuclease SbcCD ATPase subunit
MDEGFVNLRRNLATSVDDATFWPSFTDIMMVVAMIFMMASTALVLRNWDLVRELRATIMAEQQAEEKARSATETSATLEEQLARVRREVAELRARLAQSEEANQASTRQLNRKEQRLLALQAERQQLTADLEQAGIAARRSRDELAQAQAQAKQLVDARDSLQTRLQQALDDMTTLEQRSVEQAAELAAAQQQFEQQLVSLQGDYDDIRIKYDKLVRPARSSSGKHVVAVRYWKEDEHYQMRLRDAGEEQYHAVNREQLHARLSELKDEYADKLYVKVIIPDDSGLSYSEAWGFIFNILKKYDYYHQD